MRRPSLLALLPLLGLTGCVLGAETRPTRSQAMNGPPPRPDETANAAGYIARSPGAQATAEPPRPPRPSRDYVWLEGYWHWNGVRYGWVPGSWENRKAP